MHGGDRPCISSADSLNAPAERVNASPPCIRVPHLAALSSQLSALSSQLSALSSRWLSDTAPNCSGLPPAIPQRVTFSSHRRNLMP
jgi:hypothetical protein